MSAPSLLLVAMLSETATGAAELAYTESVIATEASVPLVPIEFAVKAETKALQFGFRHEAQCASVYTIALARRRRTVVKYVPKMSVRLHIDDLDTVHAK